MAATAETPWSPRSGLETAGGYVWLPRLLDKARRENAQALGDYKSFEKSPIDLAALKAWKVSPSQFRAWVAEGLDEGAIADRLAAHLGHDEGGRKRWSDGFKLQWYPVIMILEADEGRVSEPMASVLKACLPPVLLARRVMTGDWE